MGYKDPKAQSAYQKKRQMDARESWLRENGPCRQCGSPDNLEVDHIDPAQKVTHRIWSWSAERRAVELAKCQPLCADCHKAKTVEQMNKPIIHGIAARYRAHGCRCDECKAAHNARAKIERDTRKAKANSRGEARTPDLAIMSGAL